MHTNIYMEVKLPKFERMVRHRTEVTCTCNFEFSSKQVAHPTYGGIQLMGGTALLAMHLKLLNAVIVRLFWSFRGIKKWFIVHCEENILIPFTYIIFFLHREIKFSFQYGDSESRPWRQYSVLHKVKAKTCHLNLTGVPVVEWKVFMLHFLWTQPPSSHGACKEGHSLQSLNGSVNHFWQWTKIFFQAILTLHPVM